ncbi:hypothetical protein LY78DRAFT_591330 [Colletotrichum sublineola]|nr:hypothetical protein LY78DRAFT_591330 [Colletotrichum sublineola]
MSPCHLSEETLPYIPSIADDVSHLAPDFDPEKLSVPKLRNVLLANGIEYGTAKKGDLVRLFRAEISPKAAATLKAMADVQPTANGIIDA